MDACMISGMGDLAIGCNSRFFDPKVCSKQWIQATTATSVIDR